MTKAAPSPSRTRVVSPDPSALSLNWLLDEMVKGDLITAAAARQVVEPPKRKDGTNQHPLVVAAAQDWPDRRTEGRKLSLEVLTQWLAHRARLPYVRIDPLKLEVATMTDVVPYAYASRSGILPIKSGPAGIVFAVKDPFAVEWMRDLEPALKLPLKRVCANPLDIDRFLVEFYAIARSVKITGQERSRLAPTELRNLEQLTELSRAGKLSAEDQHVVAIVDWLLQYAFDSRASDIHLEPRRDTGNVRFRIDGILHDVYQLPAPVMPAVTSRVKILGRLDVAERRRPQDGRIRTRSPDGKEIELRVSALPTAFGEKLVLRIFNPDVLVHDFNRLGFTTTESKVWRRMIQQPHGIVLVTGPTGSGKTTTLYASLKELATAEVNVCTIEDPIEMIDGSFNQMQVQANIDLHFADGVRALLRQDPDIIMIGEIRDRETADVAVQAALTGHLVLSTLHTNDSPSAVTRLLELGVPAYLIRATLIGVLAQRLVRTLCPDCKAPVDMTDAYWSELGVGSAVGMPATVYNAVGCLECRQTGYRGRSGVYELLPLNASMQSAIADNPDLANLRQLAMECGMRPLRHAAAEKITAGLTTIDEVLALTPDPRER
ncbi:MAG TPA: GspE/PulE family protein [Steroidobacteraceae bacterium]|nr:GspE/PulE family protein [Steroidobacteraceae bacterium]